MSYPKSSVYRFKILERHFDENNSLNLVKSYHFTDNRRGAFYVSKTVKYRTGKAVFKRRVTQEQALFALAHTISRRYDEVWGVE